MLVQLETYAVNGLAEVICSRGSLEVRCETSCFKIAEIQPGDSIRTPLGEGL